MIHEEAERSEGELSASKDGEVGADAGPGRREDDQLQGSRVTTEQSGQPGMYYPCVSYVSTVMSSESAVSTGMVSQGQVQEKGGSVAEGGQQSMGGGCCDGHKARLCC